MKIISFGGPSLTRTFGLLSLITIAFITAFQVTVQWVLLREDILDRERIHSTGFILAQAHEMLRAEDFKNWRSQETRMRFERFFRRSLLSPEILRVKVFDKDMRIIWSDEPRIIGTQFSDNESLRKALQGQASASFHTASKNENRYEKDFPQLIELYVPLSFSTGKVPGTATVEGVVEIYKYPARVLAKISYGRVWIILTSLAGAIILYGALFGIVRRASRQLLAQRDTLESQTKDLSIANQELRDTQEQLRSAERLATLGEVSAAVAHGIRNPLANIRASAQVALASRNKPAVIDKSLTSINSEVDRLARWLRSILDIVRPFEPRLAPVELNGLIEDLLGLFEERISKDQIQITRNLSSDLPILMGDQVHLEQALLGVIENALDASSSGGMLSVKTEYLNGSEKGNIRVTIQDSGEGVSQERLKKVFEPFFTTKVRGTGLGLAITQKVVIAHGGHIEVESELEEGTSVMITLPINNRVEETA